MAFTKKQLTVKIKREDLPKPRSGVLYTRKVKLKNLYTRKNKHKSKNETL
jgi:hypothetical protein